MHVQRGRVAESPQILVLALAPATTTSVVGVGIVVTAMARVLVTTTVDDAKRVAATDLAIVWRGRRRWW